MSLNMNELSGLGGHLRVGPQLHPQNYNGAKVIQRGPHGMMLAPGPSYVPGRGFRWWSEQIDQTAAWQPQQLEVGVLGMGGSKPEASWSQQRKFSANASNLVKDSTSVAPALIPATIASVDAQLIALSQYRPFPDGTFLRGSQSIRSDLQIAKQNLLARRGDVEGRKMKTAMDHSGESMWDHAPSSISERGGAMFAAGARAIEQAEGGLKTATKNPYSTALLIGGVGLLGMALYSYASAKGSGPTIRVG